MLPVSNTPYLIQVHVVRVHHGGNSNLQGFQPQRWAMVHNKNESIKLGQARVAVGVGLQID